MMDEKPKRCIDPVIKYCQECKFGWVNYPEWVETYEDTFGCNFECGCTLGFENDEPNKEELIEFERFMNRTQNGVNEL